MATCPKCNQREQHVFPNGKVNRLCAVCAWALIEEFVNSPDEQEAEQNVQRIGLLARISKWFGAIANR